MKLSNYSNRLQLVISTIINFVDGGKSTNGNRFAILREAPELVATANKFLVTVSDETSVPQAISSFTDIWSDCNRPDGHSFAYRYSFGGCDYRIHDLLHPLLREGFEGNNEQRIRVFTLASGSLVNKAIAFAIAVIDWQTFGSFFKGMKSKTDFTQVTLSNWEGSTIGQLRTALALA